MGVRSTCPTNDLKNFTQRVLFESNGHKIPLRVGNPEGINNLAVVKSSDSTETMTTRME